MLDRDATHVGGNITTETKIITIKNSFYIPNNILFSILTRDTLHELHDSLLNLAYFIKILHT